MGFEVVAIVSPASGKEKNVEDALRELVKHVQDNEPGTKSYKVYRQTNAESGPQDFVVVEEYADKAAFDHHCTTDFFKSLGERIKEGSLVSKPLDIKTVEPVAAISR